MPSVADALRQHAPAYLNQFGDAVPTGHRKVIASITRCRTGALGGVLYHCEGCGREHWVGRSCGNRHCPACGKEKTYAWLEKQSGRLMPVHHFLVTFTVPAELRWVLPGSQADGYRALFDAYKAKLADQLRQCGLYDHVPREAWSKTFVVDIEPVGDGRAVLKYLAPYVHRVAISDSRIVACDESTVTFLHKRSGEKSYRQRAVAGTEFVRGFVQHTLPPGFQKIRHYGWMSGNSKIRLEEVRWLVWLLLGWTFWLASGHAPQAKPMPKSIVRCARCGAAMRVIEITSAPLGVLSEHALSYLDSG